MTEKNIYNLQGKKNTCQINQFQALSMKPMFFLQLIFKNKLNQTRRTIRD